MTIKNPQRSFLAIALGCFLSAGFAAAATSPSAQAAEPAAPAASWSTQCTSAARSAPQSCSMEQRGVLRETGRQIARVSIQIGPDNKGNGGLLVHLPLGLSIREGVSLKIDEGAPLNLDFQTCDASGCYSGMAVSAELLKAMMAGNAMTISFKDMQKKDIAIPVTLSGFSAAYGMIK